MPKSIISDTSCLIVLSKIGELPLLQKVYGTVITTLEVMKEYEERLPTDFRLSSELEQEAIKLAEE